MRRSWLVQRRSVSTGETTSTPPTRGPGTCRESTAAAAGGNGNDDAERSFGVLLLPAFVADQAVLEVPDLTAAVVMPHLPRLGVVGGRAVMPAQTRLKLRVGSFKLGYLLSVD